MFGNSLKIEFKSKLQIKNIKYISIEVLQNYYRLFLKTQKSWVLDGGEWGGAGHKVMQDTHLYV